MNRIFPIIFLSTCLPLCTAPVVADSALSAESIGIRYAVDDDARGNFESYELFATSGALWHSGDSEGARFALRMEGSIGVLEGDDDSSVFVGLAPVLELSQADFPVRLAVAVGPTLFSEHELDQLDLGGTLNFTSSLRLHWQITPQLSTRYQYQHTSNASIYDENDGLNMHSISLGYSF